MYYLDANRRFSLESMKALSKYFGENARVFKIGNKITVEILKGYKEVDRKMTQEEIDSEAIGGGRADPIDGLRFTLTIENKGP